jgi:senataxin
MPITPSSSRSGSPKDLYNKFEFTDTVLDWGIDGIKTAGSETNCLPRLAKYDPKKRQEYYDAFKPLILAELKAELKDGLEKADLGKAESAVLQTIEFKPARNIENASIIIFEGKLSEEFRFNNDVVLLQHTLSGLKILGVTCRKDDDNPEAVQLVVKFKNFDPNNSQQIKDLAVESKWKVSLLGSVTTYAREYDACLTKPLLAFENNLLSGAFDNKTHSVKIKLTEINNFNPSQIKAIEDFSNLQKGLQILQGPPGTGKTTTIVKLLETLVARHERVLVCAPSNKAVGVLASRFHQMYEDTPIAIVGRNEKITDDLRAVNAQYWQQDQLSALAILNQKIDIYDKQLADATNQNKKVKIGKGVETLKSFAAVLDSVFEGIVDYAIFTEQEIEPYDTLIDSIEALNPSSTNIEQLVEIFNILKQKTATLYSRLAKLKNVDLLILNSAKVVFCTLSIAGRSRLKMMDKVTSLIVDEAAQATEVSTLIPFQHYPSKCLLVGDTKQLPALVKSTLAKECHLDWSMMHRMVEELKYPSGMLNTQYRMHANIRSWPSKQFYGNKLLDGLNIATRPRLGLSREFEPCTFINVNYKEQFGAGNSYVNKLEANTVVSLLKHLQRNGINVAQQVGIITFYSGQVELLKQVLKQANFKGVTPQTVDGFQGDEKDIIIISFVRSNTKKKVGFLSDFRRLNVAITRAKMSLIMVGNANTLQGDTDLKSLLGDMKKRNCVHHATDLETRYWPTVTRPTVPAPKPNKPIVHKFKQEQKVAQVSQASMVSSAPQAPKASTASSKLRKG